MARPTKFNQAMVTKAQHYLDNFEEYDEGRPHSGRGKGADNKNKTNKSGAENTPEAGHLRGHPDG